MNSDTAKPATAYSLAVGTPYSMVRKMDLMIQQIRQREKILSEKVEEIYWSCTAMEIDDKLLNLKTEDTPLRAENSFFPEAYDNEILERRLARFSLEKDFSFSFNDSQDEVFGGRDSESSNDSQYDNPNDCYVQEENGWWLQPNFPDPDYDHSNNECTSFYSLELYGDLFNSKSDRFDAKSESLELDAYRDSLDQYKDHLDSYRNDLDSYRDKLDIYKYRLNL